ncbi:hypothetical protein FEM48_ZijujUnG0057100 [Ziziphus jujuba var. spinosa]|uniref:Uncharacterized protein n=1 Tax=Ziziphus jujuba var. spinosa TaxID=714518 RepID=A0A978U924_ZIZJJ|nr:hypothetical protein FEM48_ZijujUnG0057100 [Ziziphus jujuba var. spinosa]
MDSSKPAYSPMISTTTLSLLDGDPLMDPTLFRSTIGEMQYLSITWPNISFYNDRLQVQGFANFNWAGNVDYQSDSGLLVDRRGPSLSTSINLSVETPASTFKTENQSGKVMNFFCRCQLLIIPCKSNEIDRRQSSIRVCLRLVIILDVKMMEICHQGMAMGKCTTPIINVWEGADQMDRLHSVIDTVQSRLSRDQHFSKPAFYSLELSHFGSHEVLSFSFYTTLPSNYTVAKVLSICSWNSDSQNA